MLDAKCYGEKKKQRWKLGVSREWSLSREAKGGLTEKERFNKD